MFSHRRVQRFFSEYHDGELSPVAASDVKRHLEACEACATEYRTLSRTSNALRHLPRLEAPPSLARAIRRRIDEEVHGMLPILRGELLSSLPRPILLPALSLSAVLMVGLVSTALLLDPGRMELPKPPTRDLGGEMISPRFKNAGVDHFPFSEVQKGKEGEIFARASIDQDGAVTHLQVIYRSGDERMIARTLQAVQSTGFEPARLGEQAVPVRFLLYCTTTEVRLRGKRTT